MATFIKPSSFSGLNTSHALYANISAFYEFGVTDTNLVGGASITTTNTTVENDADIGYSRAFGSTSTITGTASVQTDCTVLYVVRPYSDRTQPFFVVRHPSGSGHEIAVGFEQYSNGRWTTTCRGNYGSFRYLNGTSFTTDAQLQTGHAVAHHIADSETMKLADNGTIDSVTNTGSTSTFSPNPFSCSFWSGVGASVDVNVGAIIVFNKLLSDAELQSVTSDPWAMLQIPASITNIDGDNSVNQGQQSVIINMANVPTSVSSWSASIGGNALTTVAWGTNQTATVHIPSGQAVGTGQQLSVTYTP